MVQRGPHNDICWYPWYQPKCVLSFRDISTPLLAPAVRPMHTPASVPTMLLMVSLQWRLQGWAPGPARFLSYKHGWEYCQGGWVLLRLGSKSLLWVQPFLPFPKTTESMIVLREKAGRALLLLIAERSSLTFNLQKGWGAWPEDVSFSSKCNYLSGTENCFSLKNPSHFHPLTTLLMFSHHCDISKTTSVFPPGIKKEVILI